MKKFLPFLLALFAINQLTAQPVSEIYKELTIAGTPATFSELLLFKSSPYDNQLNMKRSGAFNNELTLKPDSLFIKLQNEYFFDIFTYDSDWNTIETIRKKDYDGVWANYQKKSYTYNVNGNPLSILQYNWENGEWKEQFKDQYSYDGNGNLLKILTLKMNNDWTSFSLITYTYDDNTESLLIQQWIDNGWVNDFRAFYTYDDNGLLTSIERQDFVNNAWLKQNLYTISYDDDNRISVYLNQKWENSIWENYTISNFTYNNSGDVSDIMVKQWLSGDWLESNRFSFVYDEFRNKWSDYQQVKSNGEWQNYRKTEFNLQDGFAEGIVYKWLNDEWQESTYPSRIEIYLQGQSVFFYNARWINVYYTDITGVDEQIADNEEIFHYYPNPVSDKLYIKIDDGVKLKNIRFELLNQQGQIFKSVDVMPFYDRITMDLCNIPAGLYIMRSTIGKVTSFKKIIIVR